MMGTEIRARVPDSIGAAACVCAVLVGLGSRLSWITALTVLVAVAVLVGTNADRLFGGLAFAVVGLACVVLVLLVSLPGLHIEGVWVVGMFLLLWFLPAFIGRPSLGVNGVVRYLIGPSIVAILTFMPFRATTDSQAIGRLAGDYAEDNAAWLLGLGNSTRGAGTVLSSASNLGGGPSTGTVLSLVRSLMGALNGHGQFGLADNGVVLLHAYIFVAVLTALVLGCISGALVRSESSSLRHISASLAATISIPFSIGLMKVGHFSASVASLCLAVAFMASRVSGTTTMVERRWVSDVWCVLALVAMGQAWFPLTGVAFAYVVLVVVREIRPKIRGFRLALNSPRLALLSLSGGLAAVLVARRLFSTYLTNILDVDYLLRNLRLTGGYAPVNSLLFVMAVLVIVVLAMAPRRERTPFSILVAATVSPLLLLLGVSYAMEPNTPQYGVLKYMFIVAVVFVPLAAAVALDHLNTKSDGANRVLLAGLIASLVMLLAPPASDLKWLSSPSSGPNAWSGAIVEAIRSGRRPVCLNTVKENTDRDYEAYLCTRIASALGVYDTYAFRTWTAANICQIPIEQARDAFDAEFRRYLTVILFDPKRVSSGAGCQSATSTAPLGWVSALDWNTVLTTSETGREVDVSGWLESARDNP